MVEGDSVAEVGVVALWAGLDAALGAVVSEVGDVCATARVVVTIASEATNVVIRR